MNFRFLLIPMILLLLFSCNDDIFDTTPSTGELTFSRDTVFLDTVFTNISSSTRTFKVYNKSNRHISIPSIKLGRGSGSFYRLNVNGEPGKSFEDVDILPRDSIYIFVEATIDFDRVSDPLYTDEVVFDSGNLEQEVKLVTLVQDAYFLFPERDAQGVKERIVLGLDEQGEEISVEGFYLEGDVTWGNDKPYVVYGYVGVDQGNTLTIQRGARIYFHDQSGILVEKNGSLRIEGTLERKVVLEGDRLEPFYADIPGQWGTIWLRPGSSGNRINHALIKNAVVGILADSTVSDAGSGLILRNTEIYNTSGFGLYSRASQINGSNLVIANNGQASLACTLGGTYQFTHSTFANFWSQGIREFPTLYVSNFDQGSGGDDSASGAVADLNAADFTNCIIDGNQGIEFLLEKDEQAGFEFNFKNSLLRFSDPGGSFSGDPLYDFEDMNRYQDNIINGEPDFRSVPENDFVIGSESDGIGKGDKQAARQVPFDLLGINRIASPDMGAYQHVVFEE